MKALSAITIAMAAIGGATTNNAGACSLNLPTYELMGFPISPHQVAAIGAANVEESLATPTLMAAGMPASPHQIAVLTSRSKAVKIAQGSVGMAEPITVGVTSPDLAIRPAGAGCTPD